MNMKKVTAFFLLICIIVVLSSCSNDVIYSNDTEKNQDETVLQSTDTKNENDNSELTTSESIVSVLTDWDSFDCEYFGDLPIGLLTTPDATSDIVISFINQKKGTNNNYEIKNTQNANQSCEIVIENELSIYDCTGVATFSFDWNNTLYKISFEFDDNVTPEIMKSIHTDIDNIVGGYCSTNYLSSEAHKDFSYDGYCYCSWFLQDNLKYKANLNSSFKNQRSISNEIEFERNNTYNKTNYDVINRKGTDTITVDGIRISGEYHSGDYPYVSGTAKNNSTKTVKFIKIKIALKDVSGNVIDTTWTYAVGSEGLAPGETTQWKVYCSEADDIEITVL